MIGEDVWSLRWGQGKQQRFATMLLLLLSLICGLAGELSAQNQSESSEPLPRPAHSLETGLDHEGEPYLLMSQILAEDLHESPAAQSEHPLQVLMPAELRRSDRQLYNRLPSYEKITDFLHRFLEFANEAYADRARYPTRESFLEAVREKRIGLVGPSSEGGVFESVEDVNLSQIDRRRGLMTLVEIKNSVVVVRYLPPETQITRRGKKNRMELWFYDLPLSVNDGAKLNTESRYWKREIMKSLMDPKHDRHVMTIKLDPDSDQLEGAFYQKVKMFSAKKPVSHSWTYLKTWWHATMHLPRWREVTSALISATFQSAITYAVTSAVMHVHGDYEFKLGPAIATWTYCFILGSNHRTYDAIVSRGKSIFSEIAKRILFSAPLLYTVAAMQEGEQAIFLLSTSLSVLGIEIGDKMASSIWSKFARFNESYGLNSGNYFGLFPKLFWQRELTAWLRMGLKMGAISNDANPDAAFPYLGKTVVALSALPALALFLTYTKWLEFKKPALAPAMKRERLKIYHALNPSKAWEKLGSLCRSARRASSSPRRLSHALKQAARLSP